MTAGVEITAWPFPIHPISSRDQAIVVHALFNEVAIFLIVSLIGFIVGDSANFTQVASAQKSWMMILAEF